MPDRLLIAYHFEGAPLDGLALPASWNVPAGWVRALPPGLLAPTAGNGRAGLRFVGVLGIGRGLLMVLPKYLRPRPAADWQQPATSHAAETDLVLRVLRRYQQQAAVPLRATNVETEDATEDYFTGEPALALALVDDYLTHGYWYQPQSELTTWEGARPDWPRTVARVQPLLTESGPLYPVRYGYRQPAPVTVSLVERLHRWAVRYCLETYHALLPGFAEVSYDPEAADELAELGETLYLLQMLDHALRTTYRDSQMHTLQLVRRLVAALPESDADEVPVSFFGTAHFHRVWEVACQAVFADRSASLPFALPTPTWHRQDGTVFQNTRNRLIPDVVWFDETALVVADAKYYSVSFTSAEQVMGGPGMPDLTKQILYQQALVPLLTKGGYSIEHEHNIFILPASRPPQPNETVTAWAWGHAQTNIPGWEHRKVAIWFVPPACIFQAYLTGATISWK